MHDARMLAVSDLYDDKAIPDIEQYKLNLSNLDNAPAN